MMTQEEFMDVLAMRRQGMSFKEIGDEPGYDPATISNWVRNSGPPPARMVDEADRVIDETWADRLTTLLVGNPGLLAKSLFEIVAAEGSAGSYPSVVRWAREQRGPRFRQADERARPAPGHEGGRRSGCSPQRGAAGATSGPTTTTCGRHRVGPPLVREHAQTDRQHGGDQPLG